MRTLDCLANLVEKYMKNTPKCGIGLYIMLFPFLVSERWQKESSQEKHSDCRKSLSE